MSTSFRKDVFQVLCRLYGELVQANFSFDARKKCPFSDCPLYKCPLYRDVFYKSLTVNPSGHGVTVRFKEISAFQGV